MDINDLIYERTDRIGKALRSRSSIFWTGGKGQRRTFGWHPHQFCVLGRKSGL